MNASKNLVGKRVLTMAFGEAIVGTLVALEPNLRTYIMLREDGKGWQASLSRSNSILITEQSPGVDTSQHAFWYVSKDFIAGEIVPFTAKEPAPVTIPAKPVEPTAPMTAQVLKMLRKKGDVTSIEAAGVLRCRSLSKRISELKRLGHKINRTLHEDHTGQRYARYILAA